MLRARADLGELGVKAVAKLRPLTDSKHIGKEEFVIDLQAHGGCGDRGSAHGARRQEPARRAVSLSPAGGGACGRAQWPVREPPGRQVQLRYYEKVLQEARAAQRTPEQKRELRERLRPRAKVERKISELMRLHGLKQGRYIGLAKTGLQAVLTATMVNTKRLLTLAATEPETASALRRSLAR